MKSSTIILIVGLFGGIMFYLGRKTATPTLTITAQPAVTVIADQPPTTPVVITQPVQPMPVVSSKPTTIAVTPVVAAKELIPDNSANSAFNQALKILTSTNTTYREKAQVWHQLRDAGQLDQALVALKQQSADNPTDAAYPMALGEGYYTKLQSVYRQGDSSAVAMLALQTDQSFNDALKIDPANWEAIYVKADALSHWPAEMNKGPEVIQQLSALIDQQEAMPAQPQFVQAYALLGDQYKKMGEPDKALATWQLGAQKFPNDPILQKKINGQ